MQAIEKLGREPGSGIYRDGGCSELRSMHVAVEDELGLVLPAYEPNVGRLKAYARELDKRLEPAALRVEVDAPSAGVTEALESAGLEVHTSDQRRGKGAAIAEGFDALDTDILSFVDADASTAATSVRRIVKTVKDGADVAVGTRRHPEAEVTDRSPHRNVLGAGLVVLARGLLDVSLSDYQCGAKALRREVWQDVSPQLSETGFAWDLDLLVAADQAAYRIEEVPVRWSGEAGSTMNVMPTVREFGRALVSIRRRSSQRSDG